MKTLEDFLTVGQLFSLFGSVEVHVAAVAALACAVGGVAAAGAAAGAQPPEQAVDGAQRQR